MNLDLLKGELARDEGIEFKPYRDTVGKLTIGVGHNLDDVPISHAAAMQILEDDIVRTMGELNRVAPFWSSLDDVRQRVLANMAFNLGGDGLAKFVKMLAATKEGDYDRAADEMADSQWARQVGSRAVRLISMMRTGAV